MSEEHLGPSRAPQHPPSVEIDSHVLDGGGSSPTADGAIKRQHAYSTLGLVLGVVIVLVGAVLIALGFSGSVDVTFQHGETSGHVVTGSLGIALAAIGALVVWITRYKVTIKGAR